MIDDEMIENLPNFKATTDSPEILDPKTGKYSVGLKIQEIMVGDEKGPAVEDGKLVSLQVCFNIKIFFVIFVLNWVSESLFCFNVEQHG